MYVNKTYDLQLLNHLSDENLIKYIDTSPFKNELLKIPNIDQRLKLYEKFKAFDLSLYVNDLTLVDKPYILFKIKNLKYDIKITDDIYIQYKAEKDRVRVLIQNVDIDLPIDDAKYGFDVNTIYMIYINNGLCRYAKKATKDYLDRQYAKINDDLYQLMGLYLWFKINCIFLHLTDTSIINIDEIVVQDNEIKNNLKNYIILYYDLLTQYIENL